MEVTKIKLNDIPTSELKNNNCLVEIEDIWNKETTSGILVGDTAYNKNVHIKRYGKLVHMPANIEWKKARWKPAEFPDIGDEVWFDYMALIEPVLIESNGSIYLLLDVFKLILARSVRKGIICLNGYVLAQKRLKQAAGMHNGIEILEDEYYGDIYDIKYAGKPNLWYTPDESLQGGITRESWDDKTIGVGSTVLTKASNYPILEESLHWKFKDETFYYFQRRDVMAKVEEL
jgi:hypothetical protein